MGSCATNLGATPPAAVRVIDTMVVTNQYGGAEGRRGSCEPRLHSPQATGQSILLPSPSSTQPTDSAESNISTESEDSHQLPREVLKNRERRRLSLSDCGPVPSISPGTEVRGNLVIRKGKSGASKGSPTESLQEVEKEGRETATEKTQIRIPGARDCRRLSISGMPAATRQDNFESKMQEVRCDAGYFDTETLRDVGVGYVCKKGLKPESPNQDDFFIFRIEDWGLYGVFDGHGPCGHDVSNYVQKELPRLIYDDQHFFSNPKEALRASFIKIHEMLQLCCAKNNAFDCTLSGTTATIVLHRKSSNKLYVSHVGDSRCVLGRLSKDGRKIKAVNLTTDHKPNDEKERKRIMASGGQVRRLDGDIPYRVFIKGRMYPGLAMSRAIGDLLGVQAGVISRPDVIEYTIDTNRDLFVVLCSDGVWEFMSSQDVVQMVQSCGVEGVQTAAEAIAMEAWNRWIKEEGSVVDDITTEVVYLNTPNSG